MYFMITAENLAHSLADFHRQYKANRQVNVQFIQSVNEQEQTLPRFDNFVMTKFMINDGIDAL